MRDVSDKGVGSSSGDSDGVKIDGRTDFCSCDNACRGDNFCTDGVSVMVVVVMGVVVIIEDGSWDDGCGIVGKNFGDGGCGVVCYGDGGCDDDGDIIDCGCSNGDDLSSVII